jgi:hypothetical protein
MGDYLSNLTPFVPLSLKRRGGNNFREGASPSLLFTLSLPSYKIKRYKMGV